MKMQKIIWSFTLFAVVFLFAGCGGASGQNGNRAGEISGGAVSGTAVSGDAVSGSAINKNEVNEGLVSGSAVWVPNAAEDKENRKQVLAKTKHQPYANDFHLFAGNKVEGIYQYSLTGEEENFYDTGWLSCPDVVWVDNECILYFCDYDDSETPNQFYYAPLAGGKGKKQILLNQKVLLTEAGELSYFVAKRGDNIYFGRNEKLCKVNIKTSKVERLSLGSSKYVSVLRDFNGQPCIQDDKAYFLGDGKYIYQFDMKQCKAKKVSEQSFGDYGVGTQIAVDEQNMYFGRADDNSTGSEIVKVSLDTGEVMVLLTEEEVDNLVEKYGSGTGEKFSDVGVVKWGERLYFVIETYYMSENPIALPDAEEHLVFHCLAADGSDVTFETEMSAFEKREIKPYMEIDIDDEWRMLNGSVVQVIGRNQFVIEYVEGDKFDRFNEAVEYGDTRFLLYNTQTNQAKKLEVGMPEYGLFCASGYEMFEAYDRSHF